MGRKRWVAGWRVEDKGVLGGGWRIRGTGLGVGDKGYWVEGGG